MRATSPAVLFGDSTPSCHRASWSPQIKALFSRRAGALQRTKCVQCRMTAPKCPSVGDERKGSRMLLPPLGQGLCGRVQRGAWDKDACRVARAQWELRSLAECLSKAKCPIAPSGAWLPLLREHSGGSGRWCCSAGQSGLGRGSAPSWGIGKVTWWFVNTLIQQ